MTKDSGSVEGQLIQYGIEIGFLISGFFGALLMVSKDASQRIGSTIASLLAGTACANYLTPVAISLIPEGFRGNGKYAVAFMMGFIGLKGLEILIEKFMKVEDKLKDKKENRKKNKVVSRRIIRNRK